MGQCLVTLTRMLFPGARRLHHVLKLRIGDGPEVLEYDIMPMGVIEQQHNKWRIIINMKM